jgi:peptide/nickel transport system permease protein
MMLEVLRQDYVRTARAKGLSDRIVVYRHALKNALIPVITLLGIQVAILVSGTVVVETIFGLPGVGTLLLDSLSQRDYPLIQGVTVVLGIWIMLVNLVVDVLYGVIDPRIRLGSS